MSTPIPEIQSTATFEQHVRIYDALRASGMNAQLVENDFAEPLAIAVRQAVHPDSLQGSISLRSFRDQGYGRVLYEHRAANTQAGFTLPTAGSMVYPNSFAMLTDTIVSAAADQAGHAVAFNNEYRGDDDFYPQEAESFGFHIDYPGQEPVADVGPTSGLNIHVTRWGNAAVRLAIVRDPTVGNMLNDIAQTTQAHLERLHANEAQPPMNLIEAIDKAQQPIYERYATPATDPITLEPGDVLVFQGSQYRRRDLLPVAHEFVTTSERRRFDLFAPTFSASADVPATRKAVAETLGLTDLGYKVV